MKVFAIRDTTHSLDGYKRQVEEIREKLKHASNCLPFQNIKLTDKAALLFRFDMYFQGFASTIEGALGFRPCSSKLPMGCMLSGRRLVKD